MAAVASGGTPSDKAGFQQDNVETHNWHTDTEYERSANRRLRRKEGLGAVFQSEFEDMDETGIARAYHQALARRHQHAEVA